MGAEACNLVNEVLPSSKLTIRPCQIGVGRLVKPLKMGYFQGRTVYLPEGNMFYIGIINGLPYGIMNRRFMGLFMGYIMISIYVYIPSGYD
jgi:hypothetical protein